MQKQCPQCGKLGVHYEPPQGKDAAWDSPEIRPHADGSKCGPCRHANVGTREIAIRTQSRYWDKNEGKFYCYGCNRRLLQMELRAQEEIAAIRKTKGV